MIIYALQETIMLFYKNTYEDKICIIYNLSQNLLNYIVLQMQVTRAFVHRSLKIDRIPF